MLRQAPPRRHLLDLDDFTPQEVELVLQTAEAMSEVLGRDIKKVPTLRGRVVVTLFYEASTRTRLSFEEAGKVLSAEVMNVSASGSSIEKGESLLDTALTIQAMGADTIIVRHPHSGAPYLMARSLKRCSVINAGDGWHAHPSQALLDLYTVRQRLAPGPSRGIQGVKLVIVGDALHSRVARSDIWGFTLMGAQVVLCGPPTLIPQDMLRPPPGYPSAEDYPPARVQVETDLDRALDGADVVMALRLQLERQQKGLFPSLSEYIARYQVNERRLARARENVLVMHPGPMNEGVEISASVAHGARSAIEQQV
ncbi:MAG: aspartate carbamoyltransferase catalytic subunit, partial [Chloroflexota bacterium]|nr:aspartate carbamoyltransferase catalytic subunit [Chloroflexota bacterium]